MKNNLRSLVLGAMLFFAAWTAATWLFEGRIETLLRPDAVADRIVYAFVVNLLLGVAVGIALLHRWRRHGLLDPAQGGFGPGRRTLAAISAGFVLGLAAYLVQGAPSLDPIVVTNAYAQVFVVSAAEVVVCWCVVGTAVRRALRGRRAALGTTAAVLSASILFGVYHYAHSVPFNTLPMVGLLTVVGLVTSVFFFVSQDAAGTIVFHNFLGTFGVVQALARADALAPLQRLNLPLIVTALIAAGVLVAGYLLLRRAAPMSANQPAAA